MAGKIKQTVETEFKTKGAKNVVKETEQIGKAQTRLGQASASAGRQFSAQSAGMGGLVAAYAGAAANVFALQQAFAALSRAAQFDQIIAGTNTLAAQVGSSGREIISTLQNVTNAQITMAEAAKTANIGLSAGFNADQLSRLGTIANKASRALGRDLTDALTRLTRGTAKLEPELLDELGIFTRIEPAVEAYAIKVGKSASSLTEFERRQAFANAAIEEGERKFGNINTSVPTTNEKFEQLAASVIDLATKVGSFLADKLVPLADFFTNNIAAKIILFSVLLKQVGGIGFNLFAAQAGKAFTSIGAGATFALGAIARLGPTAEAQAKKLQKLQGAFSPKSFNVGRLSKEGKSALGGLVGEARGGTLGVKGALSLQKALRDERKALIETKKELLAKKKAAEAAGRSTKTLEKRIKSLTAAQGQLRTSTKLVNRELKNTNPILIKLGPLLDRTRSVLRKMGVAARWAAKGFNILLNAVLLVGGSGAAIAEATGHVTFLNNILTAMGNNLNAIFGGNKIDQKAIAGVLIATTNESIKANKALSEFKATQIDVGAGVSGKFEREVTKESIAKDIQSTISDIASDLGKGGLSKEAGLIAAQRSIYAKLFGEREFTSLKPAEQALFRNIKSVLKDTIDKIDFKEFSLLGRLAGTTGLGAGRLKEVLGLDTVFEEFGVAERTFTGKKGTERPGQGVDKLTIFNTTEGGAQAQEIFLRLLDLQEKFNSGTLSQQEAQVKQNTIEKEYIKLLGRRNDLTRRDLTLDKAIELLGVMKTTTFQQNEQLNAIEATRKIREKFFSAEIGAAKKGNFALNEQNQLVSSQNELRALALRDVKSSFEAGKDQLKILRLGGQAAKDMSKIDRDKANLARQADEILTGARVKAIEAARKEQKALDKKTTTLKNQNEILEKQNEITVMKKKITLLDKEFMLQKAISKSIQSREKHFRVILDLMKESARFNADRGDRELATILGSQAGALFSDRQTDQITLKIEEKELNRFIADQEQLIKRQQADTRIEIDKLDAQARLNKEKDIREDEIFKKQQEIRNAEAKQIEAGFGIEKSLIVERQKAIKIEAKIFDNHVEGIARVLATDRIERLIEQGKVNFDNPEDRSRTIEGIVESLTGKIKSSESLTSQIDMSALNRAMQINATLTRERAELENHENVQKAKTAERTARDIELANERAEAEDALSIAQQQSALAVKQATDAFDQLTKAAAINANKGLTVAIAGLESFAENAKTSLNSMFTAIREGTLTVENFKQGFQDFILSIVDDIQASITEEFIVKPLKDFFANQLKSIFNIGGGAKANPAATTAAQTTKMATAIPGAIDKQTTDICACLRELSATSQRGVGGQGVRRGGPAFGDVGGTTSATFADELAAQSPDVIANSFGIDNKALTGEMDDFNAAGVSTFDEFDMSMTDFGKTGVDSIGTMGSSFSDFANSATNALFSMNGLAMTIGGAIGGAIGGPAGAVVGAIAGPLVKAGIGALMGSFASGGVVRHMAAGGMQRDRVPAMLEPGEFVMKRSSVNRIGAGNLASMNAGSSSGAPNIEVVVNNEGSPKDASASVKPQVDVNKMVVEIVTRDIRNNGPIRKSLRTGAE